MRHWQLIPSVTHWMKLEMCCNIIFVERGLLIFVCFFVSVCVFACPWKRQNPWSVCWNIQLVSNVQCSPVFRPALRPTYTVFVSVATCMCALTPCLCVLSQSRQWTFPRGACGWGPGRPRPPGGRAQAGGAEAAPRRRGERGVREDEAEAAGGRSRAGGAEEEEGGEEEGAGGGGEAEEAGGGGEKSQRGGREERCFDVCLFCQSVTLWMPFDQFCCVYSPSISLMIC